MPRGSKSKYTAKQKRQAHHVEESAKKRGYTSKRAAQIGWATVNKQDRGGKKTGSGRGKARDTSPSRKGGKASHSRTRGGSRAQHAKAGRAAHRG